MKYRAVSVSTIAHIVTLPLNGILEIKLIEVMRAEVVWLEFDQWMKQKLGGKF